MRLTERPGSEWLLPAARRLTRRAPDRIDVALELAWLLLDGGETDAAAAVVAEALARAPGSAEALSLSGVLLARQGDARAVDLLRRATALDPDIIEARVWLVLLPWDRGDHTQAEALAAELVAAEPLRAEAWEARATLHSLAGRPAEALADCEQAARLSPHLQRTQLNLAASALEAGAIDRARRASQALVDLRPWEPDPWATFAEALLRAGDLREAVAANDKALGLAPAREDLVRRGEAALSRLLGRAPTHDDARRLVGELQGAGARPSAFRLALAVLQDPGAVPSDSLRAARLAVGREEADMAERPLRTAAERWPRSSAAWAAHALVARELEAAAVSAARAVAAGPGDAETLHALGLVTIRVTGWAEAVPFFRAAAEADRDHVETRALLVLHEHGHEGEGAAAAFERLAAAAPHLFILQHHLALARRARGDWPGVFEAEDRALALEHGEADCWYFRAEARLQLADPDVDAAVADLGRALALVRGETHREVGVWLLRAQARLLQADLDGALEDARRAAAALDPRSVAGHMALDALRAQALSVAALDPTQRAEWEGLRGR
ncbi:MAG: tetratricopeptide repeat protein [Planctomycetes bacterium]|nr:tetratricopeptide repeat protein [Planctomycetota bacterium]